ncbi:MAG: hypothetical protein U5N86_12825 [Planctomycetota bacterium]|nr:hypothetical protein [Planctomycetota bacterium]
MDAGILEPRDVRDVIGEQQKTGELFGDILLKMGKVTEMDIARALVTQYRLPFIQLDKVELSDDVKTLVDPQILAKHLIVPFDIMGKVLLIAIAGTLDRATVQDLVEKTGLDVRVYIATMSGVRQTLEEQFGLTPEQTGSKED